MHLKSEGTIRRDLSRKLNLIDASINAYKDDPRAQRLGERVLLYRDLNSYGSVEIRGNDLWLLFNGEEASPRNVTDYVVPDIVEMIERHPKRITC